MTVAIEQSHAKSLLEVGDNLRDNRLGDGEMLGRFRHAFAFRYSEQDMDVPQLGAAADALGPVHPCGAGR
jgi:hypothetical protein